MDQHDSRRSTLLVLMIVIAIGLVGFGVTVVMRANWKSKMLEGHCANNQAQLMGSMFAYATNEDAPAWAQAIAEYSEQRTQVPISTRARLITTRTFALVAAANTIHNGLFYCPGSLGERTILKANSAPSDNQWGKEPRRFVSYALDWAAPSDPNSDRPMMADRDPEAHRASVMVVFGDTHVQRVRLVSGSVRSPGALVTEGIDGKPIVAATGFNPDDDLFSPIGDGGDSLESGRGDAKRAWVK